MTIAFEIKCKRVYRQSAKINEGMFDHRRSPESITEIFSQKGIILENQIAKFQKGIDLINVAIYSSSGISITGKG